MISDTMTAIPIMPANQLIGTLSSIGMNTVNTQFKKNPMPNIIARLMKKIPVRNSLSSTRLIKLVLFLFSAYIKFDKA